MCDQGESFGERKTDVDFKATMAETQKQRRPLQRMEQLPQELEQRLDQQREQREAQAQMSQAQMRWQQAWPRLPTRSKLAACAPCKHTSGTRHFDSACTHASCVVVVRMLGTRAFACAHVHSSLRRAVYSQLMHTPQHIITGEVAQWCLSELTCISTSHMDVQAMIAAGRNSSMGRHGSARRVTRQTLKRSCYAR